MSCRLVSRCAALALTPLALISGACGNTDARKQTLRAATDTSISIPLLPMSSKSEEALSHIENGIRYSRTEFLSDQAYDEFKRAIVADTGFAYAYALAAVAATDEQELHRLGDAAVARAGSANSAERLVIKSTEQQFKGNAKGALAFAESLPLLYPDNAASWEYLGDSQVHAGSILASRYSYRRVVALDSNYAYGWFRLGTTYFRTPAADTAMAERYILTGVKLWPNEFSSSFFLGRLRNAQNRLDDAVAAYSHAIAIAPTRAVGYRVRADLYAQTGRFQQARADYDAAIRLGKPDETLAHSEARAFVSAYEGKFDQCLKELLEVEQAIRGVRARAPLQHEDSLSLAVFEIALRQRQFDVAKAAGERGFATMKRLGQFDSTVTSDKELRSRYDFWETEVAVVKGQFDVAAQKLRTMEKAGVYGPGGTSRYVLGMIAQGQKRYALAEREYRRGLETQMEFYNLAVVVAAQSRPAEARSILEKLLKRRYAVTLDDALARYDAEQMLKGLSSADSTRKTKVGR